MPGVVQRRAEVSPESGRGKKSGHRRHAQKRHEAHGPAGAVQSRPDGEEQNG